MPKVYGIFVDTINVASRLETALSMNSFRSFFDSGVIRLLELPIFDRIAGYIGFQRRRKTRRQVEARLRSRGSYPNSVLTGPFRGLKFPDLDLFVDARFEKVFGFYEHELFDTLSRWSRSPEMFKTIVNVGASDGFYAVGLARLFPNVVVKAYEMNPYRHAVLTKMAELNQVTSRIHISGKCTIDEMRSLSPECPVLVVMDIEGAEETFLDPDTIPWLKDAYVLVETHNCFVPESSGKLMKRFTHTHEVQEIKMSGPVWGSAPALEEMSMHEVDALTGSERSTLQTWLIMEPHSKR